MSKYEEDDDYVDEEIRYDPYLKKISGSRASKPAKRGKRKTRQATAKYFVEDEASENSEDDEDDYGNDHAEIGDEEENEYIKQYDERKRLQRQQKIYDVNDIDQHVAEAERYAENLDKKFVHQEIQSQQLSKDLKSYLLPNISDPALWIVK